MEQGKPDRGRVTKTMTHPRLEGMNGLRRHPSRPISRFLNPPFAARDHQSNIFSTSIPLISDILPSGSP
jgi:hypothetical protein